MKYLMGIVVILFLNGCSAYNFWYGTEKPIMSYVFIDEKGEISDEENEGSKLKGYIVTWSPEFNGAFVSSTGKGCVQPAIYAKNNSGDISLPTNLFTNISNTGEITTEYVETLEKLMSVTNQSTFLSIGMYGICQLSAGDLIDKKQTTEVLKILLEKASLIKNN
jgi:hypothetical protein